MSVTRSKVKILRKIMILGVLILCIKFAAFAFTNSNAILSDALESLINIAASGFALYSVIFSSRLRDADHPYGHGKMEFVAVGFEGAMIFLSGVFIIIKSAISLMTRTVIRESELGIYFISLSGIILAAMGLYLRREGKQLHSEILLADGRHLLTDALTSLALVAGLVAYRLTGYFWIDSVLAIALALHIMFNGYKLLRQSLDSLLDKADEATIARIASLLNENRKPEWIDIHNLRLQKFGQYHHVDCHLTLPFYFNLTQVHDEVKGLEKTFNAGFRNHFELFVHTDPCQQLPCNICSSTDCTFRKESFKKRIEWNGINITRNKKHTLSE